MEKNKTLFTEQQISSNVPHEIRVPDAEYLPAIAEFGYILGV